MNSVPDTRGLGGQEEGSGVPRYKVLAQVLLDIIAHDAKVNLRRGSCCRVYGVVRIQVSGSDRSLA